MSTTTVYADASDSGLACSSTTYATARSGGGSFTTQGTGATGYVGQYKPSANYYCYEFFLQFDTSGVPDTDVISAATFSLWGAADYSTQDFVVELRAYDWGTAVENADWILGANLGNYTLLATWDTAAGWSVAGYNVFTDVALAAAINKTGQTRLVLVSDRMRAGTTPTAEEREQFDTQGYANRQPRLVITHAAAAAVGRSQAVVIA